MQAISRVQRDRNSARHAYNRMSRWYDLFAASETKFSQAGLHLLDIRPGERILEIGAGTGQALSWMVARGARPTALDISEGMLYKACRRMQSGVQAGQLDFVQADGLELPFPAAAFEAAFVAFTLELFDTPEIPLVLAECRRVLQPGGRLGVVSLAKEARPAVHVYEWFHARLPSLVDCRPIFVRESVQAAGFGIQACVVKSMGGLPVQIVVGRRP